MVTPLRVLHVVPHLDRIGGYERQALTLAGQQRRRGWAEPILLTHGEGQLPHFEQGLHGEVHRLRKGLLRHHPGRWWRRHGHRVQVVHAHALHKLSGQVLAMAHQARLPTLVKVATEDDVHMFTQPRGWEHLLDDGDPGTNGVRWRLMLQTAWKRLRRAGLFVALTDGIAQQLDDHGLRSVRLPNGVDTGRFRPPSAVERHAARSALQLPSDARCIAYLGRLAARKRVADLIAAFERLVLRGDVSTQLVLAGDGDAAPGLRQRALASPASRRIRFTGMLDDVRSVLHAADISVNPSEREGMPNAVLEAWACGVASVLSDIPAHRQMSQQPGQTACLLYPLGDETALAARLAGLLASPARRAALGSSARALIVERHAIDQLDRTYQGIYDELGCRGDDGASVNAQA